MKVVVFPPFLARFGTGRGKSHDEYRTDVAKLCEEYTERYPIVTEALDFRRFTELGDRYRERGRYREAAAVYRGPVTGIDDNSNLVDGAYDHYAGVFQQALDAYVDCVFRADLGSTDRESHAGFLAQRAQLGSPVHRQRFRLALGDLESKVSSGKSGASNFGRDY